MQVIHKNQGQKIDYIVNDNELILGNELSLNLTKYEENFSVHLDICSDKNGTLTLGLGEKYVAQIDIPPRRFVYPKPNDNEEEEPSKQSLPFDINEVILTLWRMED